MPASNNRETLNETQIKLPNSQSTLHFYKEIPKEIKLSKDDFNKLWNIQPEEKSKVNVFGMKETPRKTQCYGTNPYNYSGVKHNVLPVENDFLKRLLEWVRKDSGEDYEDILVNWYKDGQDHIGKHSDSETQLVEGCDIYSFSFGAERDFVVTSKKGEKEKFRKVLSLPNNSLVVMGGNMQKHYDHSVPKRAHSGQRINVTFRLFKKK